MGIPIPPELNDVITVRCLAIDSALWFIIAGALAVLPDTALQATGALSEEEARDLLRTAIDSMLEDA